AIPGFARYVFVDGVFAPELSAAIGPTGPLARLAEVPAPSSGAEPSGDERFALLNRAFATDGALIRVPAREETEPTRLEVLYVASAEAQAGASYPRLEVLLEPQARLELIERHAGGASAGSFVTSAVTVKLGSGAHLKHY